MDQTDETRWNLLVHYLTESGETLAPPRRKSCINGLLYCIKPREFPGWYPDKPFIGLNLYDHGEVTFHYHRKSSN